MTHKFKKLLLFFYRHEEKNASWEAVKLLPDEFEFKNEKFKIAKRKVEVKYSHVDKEVEEIWKNYDPVLVIHVGVNGMANCIHLEKCATNGFFNPDFSKNTLCDPMICLENSGKCEILETKLDVDKITKHLNKNYKPMFVASCDVGKYLCGYIYLKSLDKNAECVLFVHVPPINQPYSSDETSRALEKIIEQCLSEIMSK